MTITNRNEIHVYYDNYSRYWRARGKAGDYGISSNYMEAIKVGIDGCVTGGIPKLVVYWRNGNIRIILKNFKKEKPSPQFYQDSVP